MKLLKEIIDTRECHFNLELSKDFLNMTQKAITIKEKLINFVKKLDLKIIKLDFFFLLIKKHH